MSEPIVMALEDAMIASNALLHERDQLRAALAAADESTMERIVRIDALEAQLTAPNARAEAAESLAAALQANIQAIVQDALGWVPVEELIDTRKRLEAAESELWRYVQAYGPLSPADANLGLLGINEGVQP